MDPKKARQLRGEILRLLYVNHNSQGSRLNSTNVWSVLDREGYDFCGDEVLTMLQDMRDRGYVRFQQVRDTTKNRLFLFEIELTADGRDVFDGLKSDAAVMVR